MLTREAALGESIEGGFAGVYPVLKALEERGRVRRGYFVAGLGAAQFALPGAVDRLRSFRTGPEGGDAEGPVVVLVGGRPGPALRRRRCAGPTRPAGPSRSAGAHVVLADGVPVVFLERGGHAVTTFPAAADRPDWPTGLVALLDRGRYRSLEIRTANGVPSARRPTVAAALRAAGWVDSYKGLVRRA